MILEEKAVPFHFRATLLAEPVLTPRSIVTLKTCPEVRPLKVCFRLEGLPPPESVMTAYPFAALIDEEPVVVAVQPVVELLEKSPLATVTVVGAAGESVAGADTLMVICGASATAVTFTVAVTVVILPAASVLSSVKLSLPEKFDFGV